MIKADSPLRRLPVGLGADQAFFVDGMRHAAEICEVSYIRLTENLSYLSRDAEVDKLPQSYAKYFLDAWAFVDSCDKYVGLWLKQPNALSIPEPFHPDHVRKALRPIREIRNVSDHLAANKNRLLQQNCASFGILSWIMFFERNPPFAKTYVVFPGILKGDIKFRFTMPKVIDLITNDIGHVSLKAAKHTADLTQAYNAIRNLTNFLEKRVASLAQGREMDRSEILPCDLLAKAEVGMEINERDS